VYDPLLDQRPRRRGRPCSSAVVLALTLVVVGGSLAVGVAEGIGRLLDGLGSEKTVLGASGPVMPPSDHGLLEEPTPHLGEFDLLRAPERAPTHVPEDCQWLVDVITPHGLPEWMAAVAWRESRCQSHAHNDNRGTGDDSYGLFQINTLGYLWREVQERCLVSQRADLLNVATNIACAAALYQKYGYAPWDSGHYFQH